MSIAEMAEEVDVHRVSVKRYLGILRNHGVVFSTQWEPDDHGWHLLYRLKSIQGLEIIKKRPVDGD